MKQHFMKCLMALTLLCALPSAWAAEKVAEWRIMPTRLLTFGDYTLDATGATLGNDGALTVGTAGIRITGNTWDPRNGSKVPITVVMRFSNLEVTEATADQVLIALDLTGAGGAGDSAIGVGTKSSATDNKLYGIWQNGAPSRGNGQNTIPTDKGIYTLIFQYGDTGTYAWYVTDGEEATVTACYSEAGLKGSGVVGDGITLGAKKNNTIPANGMKIHAVSVYSGALADDAARKTAATELKTTLAMPTDEAWSFTDTDNATEWVNVASESTVTLTGITVNNTDTDYFISGKSIGGTASVTKQGTGTLWLGNANTFTGGLVIEGGTVIENGVRSYQTGFGAGKNGGWGPQITVKRGVYDLNKTANYRNNSQTGDGFWGVLPNAVITMGGIADTTSEIKNGVIGGHITTPFKYDATNNPGTATVSAEYNMTGTSSVADRTFNIEDSTATTTEVDFTGGLHANTWTDGSQTTIIKAGDGTMQISCGYGFLGLKINAGTVRMNQTEAFKHAASETEGRFTTLTMNGGTLDLNGMAQTIPTLAGTSGTILSTTGNVALVVTTVAEDFGATFKASAGTTLDLTKVNFGTMAPVLVVESEATLILPAGKEGTENAPLSLPEGATLKLLLTEEQLYTTGYAANVTGEGAVSYLKTLEDGTIEDVEEEDGTTVGGDFTPAHVAKTLVWSAGSTAEWNATTQWTIDGSSETKVFQTHDTIVFRGDATVTVAETVEPLAVRIESGSVTLTATTEDVILKGDITIVEGASLTLAGTLKVSDVIEANGNLTATVAAIDSAETITMAEGKTLFVNVVKDGTAIWTREGISGTGWTWEKVGAGTLTLNVAIGATTRVIREGTVKFGTYASERYNGAYTVGTGATLDINDVEDQQINVTLNEGATLANSGTTGVGTGKMQTNSITLSGNATIHAATASIGLVKKSHARTALNLNDYTLTKTGTGTFHISNAEISAGTIKIDAGSIDFFDGSTDDSMRSGINAELILATNSATEVTVSGELFVDANGSIKKTGSGAIALSGLYNTDAFPINVEAGTLTYSGKITDTSTVSGGKLKLTNTDEVLALGKTITVNDGAVLEFAAVKAEDNDPRVFATVTGDGKTLVSGTLKLGKGGEKGNILTDLEVTGTLNYYVYGTQDAFKHKDVTIVSGATVTKTEAEGGTVAVAIADTYTLVNNGTMGVPVTIEKGATFKGEGSFSDALTFADGAIYDTIDGIPTVTGDVALGSSLTVKVAAIPTEAILSAKSITGTPEGTIFVDTEDVSEDYALEVKDKALYIVEKVKDVVFPTAGEEGSQTVVVDGTTTDVPAAEVQDALNAAVAKANEKEGVNITSVTIVPGKVEGGSVMPTPQEAAAAIGLFDGVMTVVEDTSEGAAEGAGIATVAYAFGISSIELVDSTHVDITASLSAGVTLKAGTTVTLSAVTRDVDGTETTLTPAEPITITESTPDKTKVIFENVEFSSDEGTIFYSVTASKSTQAQ